MPKQPLIQMGFVALLALAVVLGDGHGQETQGPTRLKSYQAAQTKGDVRVVLLEVSRNTVFSSQFVKDNAGQKTYAIPSVYVRCLIEHVGKKPPGTAPAAARVLFTVNGQEVPRVESVASGGVGTTAPYDTSRDSYLGFAPRKVTDRARSYVRQYCTHGLAFGSRHSVDLKITTGFDGAREEFVFAGVPLY